MKTLYAILFVLLVSTIANASAIGVARSPAGTLFTFAGASCPAHSVVADGSSQLRAGTYANLFAAISTAYGTADGTHFNLPDLRGKFARGVDGTATNDPDHASRTTCNTGGATGNAVGSCQLDQVIAHTHVEQILEGGAGSTNGEVLNGSTGLLTTYFSTSANSGAQTGGAETRPLNVYVLYCVWY